MRDYVICTDSGCDIDAALLKKWGVEHTGMTFAFDGDSTVYNDTDMTPTEFYDRMRQGGKAKTSAINPESFKEAFSKICREGYDVLYLGFSSGLSTTYNSSRLAAEEVKEEFPQAKIITVDTRSASAGQGLSVYFAVQKKASGASVEETAEYVETLAPKICHFFTVDDLEYLKRGGRISTAAAAVGSVLSVKPIITVDEEGRLVGCGKVRGRKAAIESLAQKYEQNAENKEGIAFICNSECADDAQTLERLISERCGAKTELITDMGPIIGAHVGPGALGVVFLGK